MTAETTLDPTTLDPSSPEAIHRRAIDYLKELARDAILASNESLRTTDMARAVADSLSSNLTEEEMGGLATLVRLVMDSDTSFAQVNRLWDLADRVGRGNQDRRKPVERAVEDFIGDMLGYPAKSQAIAGLVAGVYGREPGYYKQMIDRVAPARPQFFLTRDKRIAVTRWLPEITSDDPEDVEFDNFEDVTELRQYEQLTAGVKPGDDPLAYGRALVEATPTDIPARVLLYLVWKAFPDSEPQAIFNEMIASKDFFVHRGPRWATMAERERLVNGIIELARTPETAATIVAVEMPEEEEEEIELPTLELADEDIESIYEYMSNDLRSFRLSELLQEVLETFPGGRSYPALHESLRDILNADPRFVWVGAERYRLDGTMPDEPLQAPEGLTYDERVYLNEEGEEVDHLLPLDRWKFNVDEQVRHPLVLDYGDDDSVPDAPPARLDSSPALHHYVAGTRYVRNFERDFFTAQPELQELVFNLPDGTRAEVWLNNRLGLLYGLKDWYENNLPWVGGLYHIEKGGQPDEFRVVYTGETEPLADIPLERLQELLMLRGEAETEGLPLQEIITRILRKHPEGLHFATLFAQVNVVRRVRRDLVASVLSEYRWFAQNVQQPGIWTHDEKRAQRATKKKGPRRVREYDEDDELLDE